MASYKTGDRIIINSRETTVDDEKSGLYYKHFGGLTGVVDRLYDDSVCIHVDLESLSNDMKKRHDEIQEFERKRWLSSLSDEARNRLNAEQKKLKISYKILVSINDISKDPDGGKKTTGKADSVEKESKTKDNQEAAAQAASPVSKQTSTNSEDTTQARLTENDLAKAEEEFLSKLQQK